MIDSIFPIEIQYFCHLFSTNCIFCIFQVSFFFFFKYKDFITKLHTVLLLSKDSFKTHYFCQVGSTCTTIPTNSEKRSIISGDGIKYFINRFAFTPNNLPSLSSTFYSLHWAIHKTTKRHYRSQKFGCIERHLSIAVSFNQKITQLYSRVYKFTSWQSKYRQPGIKLCKKICSLDQ